jgi:cathepsin O
MRLLHFYLLFLTFSRFLVDTIAHSTGDVEVEFQRFMEKYGRKYVGDEFGKRLSIFASNLKIQRELNRYRGSAPVGDHHATAWYGVNKFSDLSPEEFKERYLTSLNVSVKPSGNVHKPASTRQPIARDLPKAIDWRVKGIVSKPQNQEACGGCWAFATVETVESMRALKYGMLTELSIQQTLDCSLDFDKSLYSCSGGDTCTALEWMSRAKVKIVSQTDYPLTNSFQWCKMMDFNKTMGVIVSNYTCDNFQGAEYKLLHNLAMHGPLAVTVDASNWVNYQGGVIQYHCGEVPQNHAVQIVGYNTTGQIPYYIVKNSWGTDFGHDGYLYVMFNGNTCRIAERVSLVDVV